jgi:hypothetical protein
MNGRVLITGFVSPYLAKKLLDAIAMKTAVSDVHFYSLEIPELLRKAIILRNRKPPT